MESLDSIGSRLGLDPEDIQDLKRDRRKWKVIFWVAGVIVVIITFIVGFLLGWFFGGSGSGGSSYPYAVSVIGLVNDPGKKVRKWLIPLIAVLGFLTGLSQPVFGDIAIDYGVYSRKGDGT